MVHPILWEILVPPIATGLLPVIISLSKAPIHFPMEPYKQILNLYWNNESTNNKCIRLYYNYSFKVKCERLDVQQGEGGSSCHIDAIARDNRANS